LPLLYHLLHLCPVLLSLIIDPALGTTGTMAQRQCYACNQNRKWSGGVLAGNGNIYGIPSTDEFVLTIDPAAGTADTSSMTGLASMSSGSWSGGVLAGNGNIYGIPYDDTSVLIIDPASGTTDTSSMAGLTGSQKWSGGVLAGNGNIYGIPYGAESVLMINPPKLPEMQFGGCGFVCTQPADTTGFIVTETQLNVATGFAVTAGCADNYQGDATVDACASSGPYSLTGCSAIVCTQPADTTGFASIVETQLNVATGFAVTAECADNYQGDATVDACASSGRTA
jgi:hypothetical protein